MRLSRFVLVLVLSGLASPAASQQAVVLRPDGVFDGEALRAGWAVLVEGDRYRIIRRRETYDDLLAAERV